MTHDELLDIIDFDEAMTDSSKSFNALRAVVELHHEHVGGAEKSVYCYNCQMKYPCPTIQAIEKELN